MCIRITKELKHVYENVMHIDLSQKIFYPTFCAILQTLGYLDRTREVNQFVGTRVLSSPAADPLV